MAKATTKETIKKQTLQEMRDMGTYRKEYDRLIDLYAEMWAEYHALSAEYSTKKGYKYSTNTADGGDKRSSLAVARENLRRDIFNLSDRLMLNPKVRAEPAKGRKKSSKLSEVFSEGR